MGLAEERKQRGLMMANQWKQSKTNSQKSSPKAQNSALDGIAKLKGEKTTSKIDKGVVRVRLVVKKEDLRKMLEEVSSGRGGDHASFTVEQKLIILRKQHSRRAEQDKGQSPWKPILQSIPEEL